MNGLQIFNYHCVLYLYYSFPSPKEYKIMASAIFKFFQPSLENSVLSQEEKVKYWRTRLTKKWQNSRARTSGLYVVPRKKTLKIVDPLPNGPQVHGVTNYLPVRLDTEDDVSIERHIEELSIEYKKRKGSFKGKVIFTYFLVSQLHNEIILVAFL